MRQPGNESPSQEHNHKHHFYSVLSKPFILYTLDKIIKKINLAKVSLKVTLGTSGLEHTGRCWDGAAWREQGTTKPLPQALSQAPLPSGYS